jgi:lantibiotic modifying enzyme
MNSYLETASAIARRICRDAIWAGDSCNWIGPFNDSWNMWDIRQRSFGPDLYSGTSGVALFLASADQLEDEPLIRKTAEGAANHAHSHALDFPPASRIGVYSGTLGIAWSLIRLGELLGTAKWQERGARLLAEIDFQTPDAGLDVMSGCAGAIPAILALSRRLARPALAEAAVQWGERLENAAVRSPEGWSWKTIDASIAGNGRNLTGFSHGAAGIGWAFVELFAATRESRFQAAGEEAFRYERAFYSPEVQNWPDFRDYLRAPGSPPVYGMAWCHGAPGIALSRLCAWRLTGSVQAREEAEIAAQSTRRALESPGAADSGFSLCHGCAGNADVLLEASRYLNARDLRELAVKIADRGIEQFEAQRLPWPCGIPRAGETPCLMLGAAGVGYFYLRLASPETPSVLIIK